jgi:hypothetical protein
VLERWPGGSRPLQGVSYGPNRITHTADGGIVGEPDPESVFQGQNQLGLRERVRIDPLVGLPGAPEHLRHHSVHALLEKVAAHGG